MRRHVFPFLQLESGHLTLVIFFMDIRVAHQVHERAFSWTGREKGLREFVTQVTLVIVPSVLRREMCSLGIPVRSEQL